MLSLRIVVADDETDVLGYYQVLLHRLGHQVVGATDNGDDLVALCRELRPDLVITDLRMPGLNGDEAARVFWADHAVPVLFVSAAPPDLHTLTAGGAFPALAVAKPLGRAELEGAMAGFFPEVDTGCRSCLPGAMATA
jgi:response regulator NasT